MKYYEKIDGLRCVAISLVLIEHFSLFIGKRISAGYYGVDLFFVIIGFLITSILLKPTEKPFKTEYKNFLARRTLRIFPIYYLTIFILWVLNLAFIREKFTWFLTYTFNYAWVYFNLPLSPVTHFWSLSVEEQFYLFWPLIVLSLKKEQRKLLWLILLIIIVGYSQYIFNIFPSLSPYNYAGLLTRMASLGLGAMGAVLMSQNLIPEKLFNSKAFECAVFVTLIASLVFTFKFKVFLLGLCSFYLVIKATKNDFFIKPFDNFLKNKHVIRIGTLAYGIYIFHLPIGFYTEKYIFDPIWLRIDFSHFGIFKKIQWNPWIIKLPLYSLITIGVASLSFKYIEKPILQLKNKYFKY